MNEDRSGWPDVHQLLEMHHDATVTRQISIVDLFARVSRQRTLELCEALGNGWPGSTSRLLPLPGDAATATIMNGRILRLTLAFLGV
jgi:hypothetical protein